MDRWGIAIADDPIPLDTMRARMIADPALQDRLAAIVDPAAFVTALCEWVAGQGMAPDRGALAAALQPDPLGLRRFDVLPVTDVTWPHAEWLPCALASDGQALTVEWAHFGGQPLDRPFFEESLRAARARPISRLLRRRTLLAALADTAPADARVPDGFVFHLSRTGSTLVAQMLAAVPGSTVVSEAPSLDAVVQLAHTRPDIGIEERARLLRAMVAALGRDRSGARGPFVVKLDSWHTLALPLFRHAFPDTPWVFLFREPVEVIVSHLRIRGSQAVPGTMGDLYGIEGGEHMPAAEYVARVLARICEGALAHREGGLFVDYRELPAAVATRIVPHFGLAPNAADRDAMAAAARRDAKNPAQSFAGDTRDKQRAADDVVRAAAATHLAALHDTLAAVAAGQRPA